MNNTRLQSLVNVFQHDSSSIQELLDFTLNEAISMTFSKYGYIYYYNETTEEFTLNSWSRDVMQACTVANPQSLYNLDKTGIWGEAVRQRKPIVINDFASPDPLKKGYPEGHVQLTRFMTIPLFEKGRIVAVVGVANKEDLYNDTDLLQLSLLMDAAWKVSERKRIEIELRSTTDYLENLFNCANAPIVVWDPQFYITRFNQAFVRLTGREAADVIGKNITILFSEKSMEHIRGTIKGERWESVEIEILHKNGSIATVLWNSATLFDNSGTIPVATMAQGQDITERKRAEEELKQKNAELERFIYTVSHDLKSPLVTISSFLTYLEQDITSGDKERITKDIRFMRSAADKMGVMLAELLELARVGRLSDVPELLRLTDLQQEALQLLAGSISKRGVQVVVAESFIQLSGKHQRLLEIWLNLVENSVKYMGNQVAPLIELGLEPSGCETVFFVRDNGIGIDARYKENIFGLFNKLDLSTEGGGLGLAMVKRIVEMYDGRIWVESEGVGHGSCFKFTLPAAMQK